MRLSATISVLSLFATGAFGAELPAALEAPGATSIMIVHGVGAQIYECKADASKNLNWAFREPVAVLIRDGKTIGRHAAGPSWGIEGSLVVGKPNGQAPGATVNDIPWLKLAVTRHQGEGPIKDATIVRRTNTSGGVLQGACKTAGDLIAQPYAADYEFLKN